MAAKKKAMAKKLAKKRVARKKVASKSRSNVGKAMANSVETQLDHNYLQEQFCQQYAGGEHMGNATRSYLAAGYDCTEEAAAVASFKLLRIAKIKKRITELQAERLARLQITGDMLLMMQKEAAEMDYGDLYDDDGNLLPVNKMPDHVRRNIAEMTVTTSPTGDGEVLHINKIKMTDRQKARETLMKYKGMLVDKVEHSGAIDAPYQAALRDQMSRKKNNGR